MCVSAKAYFPKSKRTRHCVLNCVAPLLRYSQRPTLSFSFFGRFTALSTASFSTAGSETRQESQLEGLSIRGKVNQRDIDFRKSYFLEVLLLAAFYRLIDSLVEVQSLNLSATGGHSRPPHSPLMTSRCFSMCCKLIFLPISRSISAFYLFSRICCGDYSCKQSSELSLVEMPL